MATEEMMVIGIVGGTGSGKTTLTNRLKERFGDEVTVIYHDNYYKRHDELTYEERCLLNYDHPECFRYGSDDGTYQRSAGRKEHSVPCL